MGISPEVAENVFSATKGLLGIDDPALAVELSEERAQLRPRDVRATIVFCQELEPSKKLPSKERTEGPHRKEIAGTRALPVFAVGRETAAGDDAMQMRMEGEFARPCVQYRGDAKLRAEVFLVPRESLQSVRSRGEEQIENGVRGGASQGAQLSGQGEDHMKVVCWQETLLAALDPTVPR